MIIIIILMLTKPTCIMLGRAGHAVRSFFCTMERQTSSDVSKERACLASAFWPGCVGPAVHGSSGGAGSEARQHILAQDTELSRGKRLTFAENLLGPGRVYSRRRCSPQAERRERLSSSFSLLGPGEGLPVQKRVRSGRNPPLVEVQRQEEATSP